ncbi:MAG: DUF3662 domain-containing protein [Anaerolineales bacterium]|nr:DUF3662 domain-containing protein [Anaerolineales bacterium]
MKISLNELENQLQSLIEVHLVKMLPGRKIEDLITQQLATAIKAKIVLLADGTRVAPNVYTLIMQPKTAAEWQKDNHLLDTLREAVRSAGEEVGMQFEATPTISITTDEEISGSEIQVIASHHADILTETKGNNNAAENTAGVESDIPENAFIIIDGVKVIPLKEIVVNIGRRLENHIVIDDPRVSRNHAQLRAIKGRYVLFDLSSTGGTFINGQRGNQSILYPGDVISLAGVPLIFGQDNPPLRSDLKETAPLDEPPNFIDRPTAVLKRDTQQLKKDR